VRGLEKYLDGEDAEEEDEEEADGEAVSEVDDERKGGDDADVEESDGAGGGGSDGSSARVSSVPKEGGTPLENLTHFILAGEGERGKIVEVGGRRFVGTCSNPVFMGAPLLMAEVTESGAYLGGMTCLLKLHRELVYNGCPSGRLMCVGLLQERGIVGDHVAVLAVDADRIEDETPPPVYRMQRKQVRACKPSCQPACLTDRPTDLTDRPTDGSTDRWTDRRSDSDASLTRSQSAV
jgi:hypothetical protein